MTKRQKEELKRLVKEKATREYFLDKMCLRLHRLWKEKKTKHRMYIETKKLYDIFINKIDEIDERILKIVPRNTPGSAVRIKIID